MVLTNINGVPYQSTNAQSYSVPSDLFDVVLGWFQRNGFTGESAKTMSLALITSTIDGGGTRIDILNTLKKFENTSTPELTQTMAYLMNLARVPTSYAGFETTSAKNQIYGRLVI